MKPLDDVIGVILNPLGKVVTVSSRRDPRTAIIAQVGTEHLTSTFIECRPGHRLGGFEVMHALSLPFEDLRRSYLQIDWKKFISGGF